MSYFSGKTALVVGASRGFGLELVKSLHARGAHVVATVRSTPQSGTFPEGSEVLDGIDVADEHAGDKLVKGLKGRQLDLTVISAGYFKNETLDNLDWEAELKMYKTSAIGPVFLVHHLTKANSLKEGSKLFLITSESGSIALRTKEEGGANYGHHASKAASNMVGKLLSIDLLKHDIPVGVIHPGFMRTEMTAGVGYDRFWDSGGAVQPSEAAESFVEFIPTFDLSKTGQYWAPRGPRDIGEAERVLGKNLPTPLQIPW